MLVFCLAAFRIWVLAAFRFSSSVGRIAMCSTLTFSGGGLLGVVLCNVWVMAFKVWFLLFNSFLFGVL